MNIMTSDTDTRKIGMATSYPNFTDVMTCEVCDCCGTLKREPSYWSDYMLDILCGGVVNWVYSKRFNEWRLSLLYWKRIDFPKRCSQVILRKPIAYFSGFCFRNRGIHWRI